MCGIVGRVNAAREQAIDRPALIEATRIIAHRGPDGEGFYVKDHVGFGHRRLSIVDLAGGAQPMTNEDRSVWVVFNGEIYNHAILRAELQAKGHTFVTRSDTEVLVHGWEEWGEALPTRLRGMFGFAVWDEKGQTLFLSRDRLGKKPVYWTRTSDGALVFGSEVKSLLAFPDVARALNADAVPLYLALRYVPGPQTMFKGIERLQPGHSLTFREGLHGLAEHRTRCARAILRDHGETRRGRRRQQVAHPHLAIRGVDVAVHATRKGDVPVELTRSEAHGGTELVGTGHDAGDLAIIRLARKRELAGV
ncbi:MAG: asparagine synthetase B family protein, partial [Myxococcales bacterium]